MLTPDEIEQQQSLLELHRRTLASYLHRLALVGAAHAPPEVANGIADVRAAIARIKAILRESGVVIEDQPDDEAQPYEAGTLVAIPGMSIDRDQISVQGSQGLINHPTEPVSQHFGQQYTQSIDGHAQVGVAIAGDVHGDVHHGDKIDGDKTTHNWLVLFGGQARIPLLVVTAFILIFLATSVITAGANILGFKGTLQDVGLLAYDPTPTPGLYKSVPRSSMSWSPGLPSASFDLPKEPGPMRISSQPNSHPNYPRLTYPMSGDFEAVVAVSVKSGDTQPSYNVSVTGLGVYSERQNTTVLLSRVFYRQNLTSPIEEFVQASIENVGAIGNSHECNADTNMIYLKIKKSDKHIAMFCSDNKDENNWITVTDDYLVDFGDNFQIFLFAYSTNDSSITAYFSEFKVLRILN